MAAMGATIETLLAAWDDATAPLDARVREDPTLFTHDSELVASTCLKRLKASRTGDLGDFCRPWEHGDFLARLNSFSVVSWFAKPETISALECARYGWRNSALDQLHCNCCKQFLCFKIDSKLSEAGVLLVVKTFAGQLVTGHTQLCPWRENPSPEAFTMLPIATKRQVCELFISRLEKEVARMHSMIEFQNRMGSVKIADAVVAKVLKEGGGTEDVAASLSLLTLTSKLFAGISKQKDVSVSSEALVNAALLIICGWEIPKDSTQVGMLCCTYCNRRWQTFPETANKEAIGESEPPAKRSKVETDLSIDLLSQHRHFCPWLVERKSTGVIDYGEIDPKLWEFVKLPGWKQYAQALVLLDNPKDRAIVEAASSDAKAKRASDPVQALAAIRAVLGL